MIHRIAVVGGPGTGKTTLSNYLAKLYSLPVIHLDAINHLEGWTVRDSNERDQMISNCIQEEEWIIDGTYHATLKERFKKADLVIWLDYSTFAQIKGVIKRFIKGHGKEREEIPGCKERFHFEFLKYVVSYNRKKRHFVLDCLEEINASSKAMIFKNRKQLNKWIKKQKA